MASSGSPPPGKPAPVDTGMCTVFKPIHWAKEDMVIKPDNQTMLQIKEHNAVWKKMCQPAEQR